jgi:signal transduction histidine kinase
MNERIWRSVVVAGALALLLVPGLVAADANYGRGGFSSCAYQAACPTASQSPGPGNTTATAPSGLLFAVNLTDGQVITSSTYSIIVTPLNGKGASFAKVEFYIDGQLVAGVVPAQNGTATWLWDTKKFPGSTVKVIVYDSGGASAPQQYKVLLERPATVSAAPRAGLLALLPQPVADALIATGQNIAHAIQQIPVPVARGFPYILFVVLAAILLLLIIQTRDEVARAEALKRSLEREHTIAQEKSTFLQLIQHYLRTPLSILRVTADPESLKSQVPEEAGRRLQIAIEGISLTVDELIAKINNSIQLARIPEADAARPSARIWAKPVFFLPVILIGLTTYLFNYLVVAVGRIDIYAINALVQGAVFIGLALGLYVILRSRQLRRYALELDARTLGQQQDIDNSRNGFIKSCADALSPQIQRLKDVLPSLGSGAVAKSAAEGHARYQRILSSFAVVSRLESGSGSQEFSAFQLSQLLEQAKASVAARAAAKGVTISSPKDLPLASQKPAWLSYVLSSLLDNAVSYSQDRGSVEVSAAPGAVASIRVSDNGAGIAQDKLAQLFQPFYKAEGALEFTHEGMGFSLFLDKLVMHYLGGDIHAESKLGQGTAVTIEFPTA